MRSAVIGVLLALTLAVAARAQPARSASPAPASYKTVLIAGDYHLPVFDNAVRDVAARLRARGAVAPGDVRALSAAAPGARSATVGNVLRAIAAMRPGAGQGCFVFATSHGVQGVGLYLAARNEALSPALLDRALVQGCGDAPTVVVVSACFSGGFAEAPMARPNRIVLTAARPDRASFGCGAGRTYTVYDHCLLDALDRGGTWRAAYATIQGCVAVDEQEDGFLPSEPQAWFGADVADMALPGRDRAGR